MNNLSVYSASAGSGKTYSITHEYLALLLKNSDNEKAYKNIIAITFTNKATNEMKNEILKKFQSILKNNSDNKELLDICKKAELLSDTDSNEKKAEVMKKAKDIFRKAFVNILHDYSFFSVSTIDSFFQKIIRGFAREIGINYNYSLELDNEKIISDAIDILLEQAETDNKLKSKIIKIVDNSTDEGKSWNIKNSLSAFVKSIPISEYREFEKDYEAFFADENSEKNFRSEIIKIQNNFKNSIDEKYQKIISYSDYSTCFSYNDKRNFIYLLKAICEKYDDSDFSLEDYFKYCNYDEKSIKFKTPKKDISKAVLNELYAIYDDLHEFFLANFKNYKTINIIDQNYYYAGLLNSIIEIINNYIAEKGLFLISNVPTFLSEIAKNNSSSFIYEKVGTFYENYLIDEFQDTSQLQWDSLMPLIMESLSNYKKNIIVGDLKQSIYSWRGGDWELLANKLYSDFPQDYFPNDLKENWRSGEKIVNFNNSFFETAVGAIKDNTKFPDEVKKNTTDLIQDKIYSNIKQEFKKESISESFVSVNIIDQEKDDEKSFKEKAIFLLIKQIEELQENGVSPKDILILVRTNDEGNQIAKEILLYSQSAEAKENVTYELISSTSLFIYQNYAIQTIIACLKYFANKNDFLAKYEIKQKLSLQFPDIPQTDFDQILADLQKVSSLKLLYENIEDIIDNFGLNKNEANIPYLISFRDLVLDFEQKESPDIFSFLNYWDEVAQKKNLRLSEEQNAITILTIHKAKGLAEDYVFVPFCNWKLADSKSTLKLVKSPDKYPFNALPAWLINVCSDSLLESHFSEDYYIQRFKQIIESFNVLYVAFTRARKGLSVFLDSYAKNPADNLNSVNKLIQFTVENLSSDKLSTKNDNGISYKEYFWGKDLVSSITENKDKTVNKYIDKYGIFKHENKNPKEQIIIKSQFDRNKLDLDKDTDINKGIIFHKIFENINYAKDIDNAINKLYQSSIISKDKITFYKDIIEKKIKNKNVAKWFDGSYDVITESEIISQKDKRLYRPDRIMFNKDKSETIIVDYKFGKKEEKAYINQIQNYAKLLSDMKYQNISLYLWFVIENYLLHIFDGKIIEKIDLL